MIRLVDAEVRRLLSRRLFRFLGVMIVLGFLISAVVVFFQSSKDPNSGLEAARRQVEECERFADQARRDAPPGKDIGFDCGTPEQLRPAFDRRFVYGQTMPDITRAMAILLFAAAFVVGASFLGADWGTGSMATQLTWEPRRTRVFVAKLTAAAGVAAVAAVAFLVIFDLLYLPAGALRGTTEGTHWGTLANIWLRGAGLAVIGTIFGAGLANITRNTAGAVGFGLAYGAIVDPLIANAFRGGQFFRWMVQSNLARLAGFRFADPVRGFSSFVLPPKIETSLLRPAGLLVLYASILALASLAALRSRDVV